MVNDTLEEKSMEYKYLFLKCLIETLNLLPNQNKTVTIKNMAYIENAAFCLIANNIKSNH